MKCLSAIILFLYLGGLLKSQVPSVQLPHISSDKVDYSVNMGTGFASFNGSGFSSSYISPSLTYKYSQRLIFFSTVTLATNSFNSAMVNDAALKSSSNNKNGAFLFGANFQVTDKLKISGSIISGNLNTNFYNNYERMFMPNSSRFTGMNLDMQYDISKNVSLGAQVKIYNGLPYRSHYYSPFGYRNSLFMDDDDDFFFP